MATHLEKTLPLERLQMEIEGRIAKLEPLRTLDNHLRISVGSDGAIQVSGPVRSHLIKQIVLQSIEGTPGVHSIEDDVIADPDLELDVAQALTSDDRTGEIPLGHIFIHSRSGVVSLAGKLPDDIPLSDVLDVVSSVDGVRDTKSMIQIKDC
jgi:osmotically-inducible protein OsmY